jgi:hypothetical protein
VLSKQWVREDVAWSGLDFQFCVFDMVNAYGAVKYGGLYSSKKNLEAARFLVCTLILLLRPVDTHT